MKRPRSDGGKNPTSTKAEAGEVVEVLEASVLKNDDWKDFSNFLYDEANMHDKSTAFKEENKGFSVFIRMAIHFYNCGRNRELPPEWRMAYETFQKRTADPYFADYLEQKKQVTLLEKQYKKYEHLDVRPLVGDFAGDFLLNNHQAAPVAPASAAGGTASKKLKK
jgi:hypothetical protein